MKTNDTKNYNKDKDVNDYNRGGSAFGWPVVTHPSQHVPCELHPTQAREKIRSLDLACRD